MHLITEEQRAYLDTLPFKERQKEILKEEYRNGEWYADDIRTVSARDIPRADVWCFGFPCVDISIVGKQIGFYGNRSSLFFRIMYLASQVEEDRKPTYMLIENVKNLLSVNRGWDFARLLIEMDRGGYDVEWRIFNTKNFGVPQSRERLYIVGHLRNRADRQQILHFGTHENKTKILQVAEWDVARKNSNNYRVYSPKGVAPTLIATTGGGKAAYVLLGDDVRCLTPREYFRLQGWNDEYFDKAQFVNSDSQLYKQAGNAVSVPVVEAIGRKLKCLENISKIAKDD